MKEACNMEEVNEPTCFLLLLLLRCHFPYTYPQAISLWNLKQDEKEEENEDEQDAAKPTLFNSFTILSPVHSSAQRHTHREI